MHIKLLCITCLILISLKLNLFFFINITAQNTFSLEIIPLGKCIDIIYLTKNKYCFYFITWYT